jgi:hypothetical protein
VRPDPAAGVITPPGRAVEGVATKIPEIACGGGEGERIDIAVRGIAAKNLMARRRLISRDTRVRPLVHKLVQPIKIAGTESATSILAWEGRCKHQM